MTERTSSLASKESERGLSEMSSKRELSFGRFDIESLEIHYKGLYETTTTELNYINKINIQNYFRDDIRRFYFHIYPVTRSFKQCFKIFDKNSIAMNINMIIISLLFSNEICDLKNHRLHSPEHIHDLHIFMETIILEGMKYNNGLDRFNIFLSKIISDKFGLVRNFSRTIEFDNKLISLFYIKHIGKVKTTEIPILNDSLKTRFEQLMMHITQRIPLVSPSAFVQRSEPLLRNPMESLRETNIVSPRPVNADREESQSNIQILLSKLTKANVITNSKISSSKSPINVTKEETSIASGVVSRLAAGAAAGAGAGAGASSSVLHKPTYEPLRDPRLVNQKQDLKSGESVLPSVEVEKVVSTSVEVKRELFNMELIEQRLRELEEIHARNQEIINQLMIEKM